MRLQCERATRGVAGLIAPGYEFISWFGMLAPAKTPRAIVNRLNVAVVKVVLGVDVRNQFVALGAEPIGGSPHEFAEFLKREYDKNGGIVTLAGIKID